jgi:lysine-specific permease
MAFAAQGKPIDSLIFKSPMYPFGPISAIILGLFIISGQGWTAFQDSVPRFLITFGNNLFNLAGIPLFMSFYFYSKWAFNTSLVDLGAIDLSEDDGISETSPLLPT